MRKVLDAYYGILIALMTALFVMLTTVVSYQILSRYVDFVPRYLWTEEVARFSFVWLLLLGAAVAVREGSHFTIDVLPQSMGAGKQKALEILTLVLMAAVALVMLLGGLRFTEIGLSRTSTAAGVTLAYVYAAVPVSGFSMLLFIAERLAKVLRGGPTDEVSREELELGGRQDGR